MKTMHDAVRRAARLMYGGKGVPSGDDATDILEHMQGVLDSLMQFRGGNWDGVLLSSAADYSASDAERVAAEGFDPVITLPTTFTDWKNDVVLQKDLSRVQVYGDGSYVWSASLGAWNKTDNLSLSDPFPFGDEDFPGIVAMTVKSAAREFGAVVDQVTLEEAANGFRSIRSRLFRRSRTPEPDLYPYRCNFSDYA